MMKRNKRSIAAKKAWEKRKARAKYYNSYALLMPDKLDRLIFNLPAPPKKPFK